MIAFPLPGSQCRVSKRTRVIQLSKMSISFDFCAYFVVLLYLLHPTTSEDILGCGGFVKSEVEINFSLVEVKLYTRQGSLKYQTDCAPNNGYYMIPVYDKGDYILKVEPPPGWTFNPQSVELHIDGKSDACSKGEDINFEFTGFGVIGRVVSRGHSSGPAGVTLSLSKVGSSEAIKKATSIAGGAYTFENVLPGEYDIKASHPSLKFDTSTTRVKVDRETGNAGSVLSVRGYNVEGKVLSDGEPIKGVHFLLFSQETKSKDLNECDKSEVKGYPVESPRPLCHVTSREDGSFVFPSLPTGEYHIVPFYKGDHITFDVVPAELKFSIDHDSLVLTEPFQVAGFSVQGKVLSSAGGEGVADAHVMLDGREQAVTKADGSYHLDSMKAGTYRLKVTAKDVYFDTISVKVTPNTPQLPDVIASRFSLCGQVTIDKVPEALGQVNRKREITVTTKGQSSPSMTLTSGGDGAFCAEVKPGTYVLNVVISDVELRAGLKLAPTHKEVTVTDRPVHNIKFSQFRATVAGTITCLETCGVTQLSLIAIGRSDDKLMTQANEVSKGATFQFTDVMPGKYTVTLLQDEWCWKEKTIDIEVVDENISGIDFVQSGYILSCSLSHDISLHFEHESKPGNVGSFNLSKGINKFCLAEPGVYRLSPESCHQFEQDIYRYDTSVPSVLTLTAKRHLVEGTITTRQHRADIYIVITSSIEDKAPTKLGPLTSDKEPVPAKDGKAKPATGPFTYKFSHWAKSGERLTVHVSSAELLFYPPTADVTVQAETCPGQVVEFEGRQGVFITGQVQPALKGVQMSITASLDPDNVLITLETDEKGSYRVGPLHGDQEYQVAAQKEGYVLTAIEGKLGYFKAFKLGEVSVKVIDDSKAALQGVLLSLSGGAQYRSNKLTEEDGTHNFLSLSPGQYFLRPMMKEYKFEPTSQMIDVTEGSTVDLTIKGTRVAFSCYGAVTSLNGEPEPGIVVEAVGQGGATCQQLQEESKTEADGSFRIRGLQPECDYDIQLKTGDVNQHIERSAPKVKKVKVTTQDMSNVNIIAFRRMNQMDLSGNVITNDQKHISTLKVRLYRELSDSPLHTVSLGATSFFYLPSLTIDTQNYMLRLESSLSRASYDYTNPEINFVANVSYKHFTFHFDPQPRNTEQDLNHSSFLVLPFTAIIILLAYNYQKLVPMFSHGSSLLQGVVNRPSSSSSHSGAATLEISPELLDAPIQKKKKVRKT